MKKKSLIDLYSLKCLVKTNLSCFLSPSAVNAFIADCRFDSVVCVCPHMAIAQASSHWGDFPWSCKPYLALAVYNLKQWSKPSFSSTELPFPRCLLVCDLSHIKPALQASVCLHLLSAWAIHYQLLVSLCLCQQWLGHYHLTGVLLTCPLLKSWVVWSSTNRKHRTVTTHTLISCSG